MGEVAARVRQNDLELRVSLHHAVEDEVTCRDGRLHRIADHVVEVVIDQPFALRETDRMHEDHGVESLCPGEEPLQVETRVGKVHPVDAGVDLHAAQAELFHAALELGQGEIEILQRHRSERDEAVRPRRDDLCQPVVHHTR